MTGSHSTGRVTDNYDTGTVPEKYTVSRVPDGGSFVPEFKGQLTKTNNLASNHFVEQIVFLISNERNSLLLQNRRQIGHFEICLMTSQGAPLTTLHCF